MVGGTVSFRASLTDDYGKVPGGSYQYKWRDNAIPAHTLTVSLAAYIINTFEENNPKYTEQKQGENVSISYSYIIILSSASHFATIL